MKLKAFILGCFVFGTAVAEAQPGGGFQRQTVEERVAVIHNKIDSAFKLAPNKLIVLDSALAVLFRAQDEKMRELFSGGMPDRDVMMAERKKYTDARDEMIKAMVTEEEYKIWIEKIAPTLRGGRGPGSGGSNRQNQR